MRNVSTIPRARPGFLPVPEADRPHSVARRSAFSYGVSTGASQRGGGEAVSACKHIALDFYGCNRRIADGEAVRAALVAAALAARSEIVDSWARAQALTGVVAIVVMPEAHITLHSYPEDGYAAVDILHADWAFDTDACQGYLEEFFSPAAVVRRELYRGGDSQTTPYRQ